MFLRDRTNIRDALENHEENKNKDLSSTICEFVSLECTPQVRYNLSRDLCEIPLIIWKRHLENRTLHFDWLTVSYEQTLFI